MACGARRGPVTARGSPLSRTVGKGTPDLAQYSSTLPWNTGSGTHRWVLCARDDSPLDSGLMEIRKKPVLLVVDPQPYSRAVAEMVLRLQYNISQAVSVRQAVDNALRNRPTAI